MQNMPDHVHRQNKDQTLRMQASAAFSGVRALQGCSERWTNQTVGRWVLDLTPREAEKYLGRSTDRVLRYQSHFPIFSSMRKDFVLEVFPIPVHPIEHSMYGSIHFPQFAN